MRAERNSTDRFIRSSLLKRAGIGLFALILPVCLAAQAEDTPTTGKAWADSVFKAYANGRITDGAKSLPTLHRALSHFLVAGDTCKAARIMSWRCYCYDNIGQLDSAVIAGQLGLNWFHPGCDSLILMSLNVNLSNALLSLGESERVLAISEASLGAWNDSWPYSKARDGLYTNRAIALANMGEMDGALEAFRDVLRNARKEGVARNEIDALVNLSAVFGMMGEQDAYRSFQDSSEFYHKLTLPMLKELGDQEGLMLQYGNIAQVRWQLGKYQPALAYLDSSDVIALSLSQLNQLVDNANLRSKCLFALGQLDEAYAALRDYVGLNDSLLNTEKVKAIADVQEKYESEKKVRTIKELEVKNLDAELKQESMRRTRNVYLFAGIGTVLIALGLYSRLRYVRRSRAAIQKEKDISEGLLLNILPEEVAAELKAKGEAEARLIDEVTVLFTDFKGFTAMSEKLSPKELVRDIHECFSEFDRIMERHGIEKIKTIGDAYMAAGGLPIPNGTHAFDAVNAALEIRDFIEAGKAVKIAEGLPFFEIRVGVHTGPVVAGIVGLKKFAYDIWGDTVNTASRMESSGSPGEVNISESTYALIKSDPRFRFTERGKVSAKGKGELTMYFVDRSA